MSTLHHLACWPAVRSELSSSTLTFPTTKEKRPCWKIGKSEARFIYTLYEMAIQNMVNTAINGLRTKCQTLTQNVIIQMAMNKAFDAGNDPLITLYQKSLQDIAKDELAQGFEKKIGLNPAEQKAAFNKMLQYAYAHLSDFRNQIPSNEVMSDNLPNEWKKTGHMNVVQMRTICGAKVVVQKWAPTSDDKKFLRLDGNVPNSDFDKLCCTAFTFLNLREEKAIPWITTQLQGKIHSDEQQFYHGDVIALMQSWGYRPVENADERDVIFYFNEVENPKVKHTGQMLANGKVKSKMGRDETAITEHEIKCVPGQFGVDFMLFRKTHI